MDTVTVVPLRKGASQLAAVDHRQAFHFRLSGDPKE
jgi:hypothetical protein